MGCPSFYALLFIHRLTYIYFEPLKVDLLAVHQVHLIRTDGHHYLTSDMYVESYKLAYGIVENTLDTFKDGSGADKIFRGNTDDSNISVNGISPSIVARYVRLEVVSFNRAPILRWNLYGCLWEY